MQKKSILFVLLTGLLLCLIILLYNRNQSSVLSSANTDTEIIKQKTTNQRMTDALGASEWEFNMLKNPVTGTIPEGIRQLELAQARQVMQQTLASRTFVNTYTFQGPGNLGGRTRDIMYDAGYNGASNRIIYTGGVSGSFYKSTDDGATWVRKSNLGDLFSVTSIAQDTSEANLDTLYYASGEALGNSASGSSAFYLGHGVYRSVDRGETWSRLAASNPSTLEIFNDRRDLISRVVVAPNGDVYIAAIAGIYKSEDAGVTWTLVLSGTFSNSGQLTDIVVTPAGRLYAAFAGTNSSTVDGIWTSTSGNSGDWTQIAGAGNGGSPAGWSGDGAYGRVVLATHSLPADTLLFALYDNGNDNDCLPGLIEADLFRWNQATTSWTNLSANLPDEPGCSVGNDPFNIQGGYDLFVSTKPDDANVVFIGGTNLYRSTDGFATTGNTTRIGGYAGTGGYTQYADSHPDMHDIDFQPGNPLIMLAADDGGIQRTTNNLAATVAWSQINTDYRTYQYYHVTLDPRTGNTKVLGGAQDNGTTRNIGGSGSNFEQVLSGDGVSVGLSDLILGSTYEYGGSQLGSITRRNSASAPFFGTNIKPSGLPSSGGQFVTVFRLDPDNTEILYYAFNNQLFRTTSASTVTPATWTELTGVSTAVGAANDITYMAVTRGVYSAGTASLFIGTTNGRVFRLDDPANAAAASAPVDISLPFTGVISSISVNPRNDDTALVTISNYGVSGIFWTGNANTATPAWSNVEGNLTLPSYRSSAIAITALGVEYFAGTSVGLFTATIDGASPGTTTWAQDGASEIGNAVVRSIALRPVDNRLLAGTHGYGMWATNLSLSTLPVSLLEFKGRLQKENVLLEWVTSSEQNSRGFEIEKSYDGVSFRKIGFVASAGNSSTTRHYKFTDPQRAVEFNYYRLRMVDIDNSAKLSDIVLVKNSSGWQEIFITNNPFTDKLNIRFAKIPNDKLLVSLYDMKGSKVYEAGYAAYNQSTLQINTASRYMARGIYSLRIETGGKTYNLKAVKQ
jgi:hypothetical protein